MAKLFNLTRMMTSTIGTGPITLTSAVPSFLSFAQAGVADGDTITYAIENGLSREMGRGVYNFPTLTRQVLTSTNDNNPINLTGNAQVAITAAAQDIAAVVISATPPTSYAEDTLWWNSTDGQIYIDYDGQWVAMLSLVGPPGRVGMRGEKGETGDTGPQGLIADVTHDGLTYGRKDGDWEELHLIPEPPGPGAYLRKDGAWIPMTVHTYTAPANVTLSLGNTWYDCLVIDVGNEGTWLVTGTISLVNSGSAIHCVARLTDGVTIMAETFDTTAQPSHHRAMTLTGVITDPAGPIKMQGGGVNAAANMLINPYPAQFVLNINNMTAVRIG